MNFSVFRIAFPLLAVGDKRARRSVARCFCWPGFTPPILRNLQRRLALFRLGLREGALFRRRNWYVGDFGEFRQFALEARHREFVPAHVCRFCRARRWRRPHRLFPLHPRYGSNRCGLGRLDGPRRCAPVP
ncbi:MAG: hypothetical protein [Microviridae sp.]|nr:MAG: hypothetical protein [Microviridae sp.]